MDAADNGDRRDGTAVGSAHAVATNPAPMMAERDLKRGI
jgi:hypothetical protein